MQPELVDTGKLQRDCEALLFVASEALSIKQLAKLTGAEEAEVSVALQKIDEEFAHRGVVLREIAGGYRFASAPAAREVVEAYLLPPKTNLSPAALETLAIVAYTQPCTKGEIEEIRGVSADSVIATLVDRRFLAESGRKESPGRPMLYKTTPEFLEAFGLKRLDDLPTIDLETAAGPLELALPIPTVPTTPAADAIASIESESVADVEDAAAEQSPQETETQPSAV
ncbi:MAG TPA: SMC-Scp complex subunit ScpB [Candidatus Sulfotelmatobacter sp.]|nr:SMC-Scp complex subunit ScpB [Candidatus Sulfotelmatobacter sp.]